MVFELRGSVQSFAKAIRRVPGLEFIDEEEIEGDDPSESPVVYLLIPDLAALRQMLSMWKDWLRGTKPKHGLTAFRDVFDTLKNLRPWGPQDRVLEEDRREIASQLDQTGAIRVEVELVFRFSDGIAQTAEEAVSTFVASVGGRVISQSRITNIAYHALLVELPAEAARGLLTRTASSIAGLDPIMHIRPQSLATTIDVAEREETAIVELPEQQRREPILALLDGVPVSQHPLLAGTLSVEDQFGLEPGTPVADRHHGTAMASLIVHGDRNVPQPSLGRRVHCVPLLGAQDQFPPDRLIVDLVYQAVIAMCAGESSSAPGVLIINLSLGNSRKPFHNKMSAWARLLDRLSHQFGILFLVSAGNHSGAVHFAALNTFGAFEALTTQQRAESTIRALGNHVGERRLLSPSETVNGLTIGAANQDAVSDVDRLGARGQSEPWHPLVCSNPSSALGPGFANSVKPDILLPGSREHFRLLSSGSSLQLVPSAASRAHGIKVAAPPQAGRENWEHYTCGTSAATAIASRTAHQIHDALESEYGALFTELPKQQRATLLKALLVHTAAWPVETADIIKAVLGPPDPTKHTQQKDNIRRFLGYGVADPDAAVACAADRATFWAVGTLEPDQKRSVTVPVPRCVNGLPRPHALSATLAWFTPILPGRQIYRSIRLIICEPGDELGMLRVDGSRRQPDQNQSKRGTVYSRRWEGDGAPVVSAEQTINLEVQREPDQGITVDEGVPFGLAVTFSMPGVVEVYEQSRARIAPRPRVPA